MQQNKQILPQEMDVWYVLPAIRKAFALAMVASGLTQKQAAALLGVTEAAVSQYKKEKRAAGLVLDAHALAMVREAVQRIVMKQSTAFAEIMRIDDELKRSGIFCQLHRLKSQTPDGCEASCGRHFLKMRSNPKLAVVSHG